MSMEPIFDQIVQLSYSNSLYHRVGHLDALGCLRRRGGKQSSLIDDDEQQDNITAKLKSL